MVPNDDAILRNSGELNTHFGKCASFALRRRRVTKGRGGRRRDGRKREAIIQTPFGATTKCVNGAIGVNFMMSLREVEFQFDDATKEEGSVIRNAPAAILHPFGREEELFVACMQGAGDLEAKKQLRSQTVK